MEPSDSLFGGLENNTDPPRGESTYPSVHILFMTIGAVIAGADDFASSAKLNNKVDWFANFLDLSSGIPSHDRFSALLNAIKLDEC